MEVLAAPPNSLSLVETVAWQPIDGNPFVVDCRVSIPVSSNEQIWSRQTTLSDPKPIQLGWFDEADGLLTAVVRNEEGRWQRVPDPAERKLAEDLVLAADVGGLSLHARNGETIRLCMRREELAQVSLRSSNGRPIRTTITIFPG